MKQNITLDGAVDLHAHAGPSPFDRRVDGYECASQCAAAGMDAVVLKEHYLPTAYGIEFIDRLLALHDEDIEVIGSVVLNYCNGGFNPFMVQSAIDYGAKVVWAPTLDAKHHGSKSGGVGKFLGIDELPEEYRGKSGITALSDGELRDDVRLCIDKIVEADVLLAIGHLSFEETRLMVEYADSLDHGKLMIDHPLFGITDLTLDQMETLVSHGAYLNFPYNGLGPRFRWSTPEKIVELIDTFGIDHCVVSSDVGQLGNPSAPEALEMMGELLLMEGLSAEEFAVLVEQNPKFLLDLD